MRKYIFVAATAAVLASCSYNVDIQPEKHGETLYLKATCDQTRTAVQDDETTVFWSPGEQINVFYGTKSLGAFRSDNTQAMAAVTFASTEEITEDLTTGNDYVAVYPYARFVSYDGEKVTIPLNLKYQTAVAGTFADGVFPSAAQSATQTLEFKNILGGIKFKVDRDDLVSVTFTAKSASAVLAADAVSFAFENGLPKADLSSAVSPVNSITIGAPDGQTLAKDTWYYAAALPATLDGGLDITFRTATSEGTFESDNTVTIRRGIFGNVGVIDAASYTAVQPVDLSAEATANCYVVSQGGTYKIKTVKGNGTESVGEVYNASVLWESFGTDVTPKVGSLVGNVSYSDGYITFSTTGVAGNAVIAAYDMFGQIIWSWHIWCSPTALTAMDQEYYNTSGTKVFTMLDRNLGATSGTPGSVGFLGLFYQWGRKDPFLGSCKINEGVRAASTGEWDSTTKDEFCGTMDYAIANPTIFIGASSDGTGTWYNFSDSAERDALWKTSKTVYDPCPAGYKVPYANGGNYVWRSAIEGNAKKVSDLSAYDASTGCLNLTNVFHTNTPCYYPLTGYGKSTDNTFLGVGSKTLCYSCAPDSNKVIQLYLQSSGTINAWYADNRSTACSVRCVKAN